MKKEKIRVYLYTRVSTTMQIDGYSLDAQKTKMKAFCDYNEYEIAGEYESSESMPEIITITDAQKVKIEIPEIKLIDTTTE